MLFNINTPDGIPAVQMWISFLLYVYNEMIWIFDLWQDKINIVKMSAVPQWNIFSVFSGPNNG